MTRSRDTATQEGLTLVVPTGATGGTVGAKGIVIVELYV